MLNYNTYQQYGLLFETTHYSISILLLKTNVNISDLINILFQAFYKIRIVWVIAIIQTINSIIFTINEKHSFFYQIINYIYFLFVIF